MATAKTSLGVRPQGGRGSHDVRPSLNCRTHECIFCTSITPSLHVSLNCRWISIGFMPRKWRNRIITLYSSNVNVAISVSKTLLQLDLVTSIQRVVQCCHLASPNLKNSHIPSNNFHVSICFHSPRKKLWDLRTWTPHVRTKNGAEECCIATSFVICSKLYFCVIGLNFGQEPGHYG